MNRTLLAAALITLATACGTAPSTGVASVATSSAAPSAAPSAVAASPTGTADPEEQGRKFARCMREHGVEMDDPGSGGSVRVRKVPGDKRTFEEAMEACREHAPFKSRADISQQDLDQMRQFARCMREHGVDMPDPDPNGGGAVIKKANPDDPSFREAVKACEGNLPGNGRGR